MQANQVVSAFTRLRQIFARIPTEILCGFLLFVMGANLCSNAWCESLTNDELVHIPSGYHYLVTGNFRLNPEHPPLVKLWACLPVLFLRPEVSALTEPTGQDFAQFTVTSSIDFWRLNRPRFQAIS